MISRSLRRKGWVLPVLALWLAAVLGASANEFDLLRLKWRDMLTQGTNASRTQPLYSNWIATVESTAQSYLNSFDPSAGRTNLFYGYGNLATDSSDITTTYEHLLAMALAYAVPGSAFQTNAALLANIVGGLDWMGAHCYNAGSVVYDNWYDFEIAVPRALNDTVVLLYDHLSPAQIGSYMSAIDHFSPTPDYTSISSPVTAYNKVWKSLVVTLRGVIVQDAAKIDLGRLALSDVFPNVTGGEGFYADGSFIFHDEIAYNTGYGVGLLDTMGSLMQLLQGSTWPITDPARTNVFRWIYDAYAPFLVRGAAMDMTSGRYPTRNGDNHERGHELLGAILRAAQVAPPADAAAIKSIVKANLLTDTSLNFLETQFPPYNVWASQILTDTNVLARAEVTEYRQFPGMDRIVHHTPSWTFGLSMSSKRVANYESTRSENLHGWFTGEGMTYLYNNDLTHYAGNFWATVDPYRLPGTTVDTITRTNGSGNGYNSPNTQVGGASLLGLYGVAVMHLNAYGDSTVSARNSWFMFDNEIVCVGNSISSSFGRETIVENRRLSLYGGNPFTVNGVGKPTGPGWAETMAGTSWAHLAGSSPGADIGYYFPTPTTVKALRESRSGRFYDINTTYGSKTPYTGNYLTMYLDHGSNSTSASYAYVLLPGLTATQVAAYAASPDITILQNNSKTTAVKENTLGITGVNFWSDGSNYIAAVSSDRKAAVIFRNDGTVLDLGMSEPTQTNLAGMRIEISTPALSVLSADAGISILQLTPTIKLFVNTSNQYGATLKAKFLLNAAGQRPTVTLTTPMDANLDAPATVLLTATARDPDGTIARLDFYSSTNRIAQVFAPASAATPVTVSNLSPDNYNFTVVAVDNAGLMATSGPISISVQAPRGVGLGTGLIGEYFRDGGDFKSVALTRTDPNIDFSWPDYPSHPVPEAPHFCARWTGRIQARRSGLHQFHALTDEGGRLWIDGRLLIDDWEHHPRAAVEDVGSISLVAGRYYDIRMEYNEEVEPGLVRLYWTPPGGVKEIVPQAQLYPADQGLKGTYYYATNMTPTYALWVRLDDTVNFAWGTNSPEPTILGVPFAVRWVGRVKANSAGQYKFFTSSDDAVRLYVNGQLLINNWTPHALAEDSATIMLGTPGQFYDLTMEYYNLSGNGTAILSWQPPGGAKEVIPAGNLTAHQNNNPPMLGSLANWAVVRGGSVNFTATATDADGGSLAYSLDVGAPAGATVHPVTGAFSWTPSSTQAAGNYEVRLRVTDTGTPVMTDSKPFTITVKEVSVCSDPQFPNYPQWKGDVVNGTSALTNGVTVSDWVLVGLFYAQLRSPSNECQKARADCGRTVVNGVTNWCGDGEIKLADWAQAGRYAAQLDPWIPMSDCPPVEGGLVPAGFAPAAWSPPPPSALTAFSAATPLRTLLVANGTIEQGQTNCVQVLMDAFGDENAAGFSLIYDTNRLALVSVTAGTDAPPLLNVNKKTAGKVGLAMAQASGETFAPGLRVLARICFRAVETTNPVSTVVRFGDQPVVREIVDPDVNLLEASYGDGTIVVTHGNDSVFEAITREENGGAKLRLLGPAGVAWQLQTSLDLEHWEPIDTRTNVTGMIEFSDPGSTTASASKRFYRAVQP